VHGNFFCEEVQFLPANLAQRISHKHCLANFEIDGEGGYVATLRNNAQVCVRLGCAARTIQVCALPFALSNSLMVSSLKRTQKV
jgi:hypothetical protein